MPVAPQFYSLKSRPFAQVSVAGAFYGVSEATFP